MQKDGECKAKSSVCANLLYPFVKTVLRPRRAESTALLNLLNPSWSISQFHLIFNSKRKQFSRSFEVLLVNLERIHLFLSQNDFELVKKLPKENLSSTAENLMFV